MTYQSIWKIEAGELTPLQLVILGTIFEVTIFVCEIPTGVVADTISRRLSVIIGFFLVGVAHITTGATALFPVMVVGAILWGLALTFISGAREAWIADELPHSKAEISAGDAFVVGRQFIWGGRFVGTWVAAALAVAALNLPLLVGGLGFIAIGVLATFLMTEHGWRKPIARKQTWNAMKETFSVGIDLAKSNVAIGIIMGTALFVGLSSEGFDRLWQKLILDLHSPLPNFFSLDPTVWWSVLNSAALLTSVAVTWGLRRFIDLERREPVVKALLVLCGLLLVFVAAFGLAGSFWAAAALFLCTRTVRRAIEPLLTSWLNHNAKPEVRATLLSFQEQAHSAGEIFGGPLLGAIGEFRSLRAAMVVSSGLVLPSLALLGSRLSALKRSAAE